MVLRLRVAKHRLGSASSPPNSAAIPAKRSTSSKRPLEMGLVVEGLSFHVGSQCTNSENFVQALNIAAAVMEEASGARPRNLKFWTLAEAFRLLTIGTSNPFRSNWPERSTEIDRLFAQGHPDPGRAGPISGRHRRHSIAKVMGRAVRDGKTCYYIDDGGLSHLFGHHL